MPTKRFILMYISEISGHHSATIAIEKTLKILHPDSEILNINAFNYTNPISEKIINRIYLGVIKRTPRVWKYLYDNPSVVKRVERFKKNLHKFNSPKMKKLFDSFKPDAVICTQAFPCGMVADYKHIEGSKLPLVAVLTDYIPHSFWVYEKVDYYIVPSNEVGRNLVNKGVPQEKVLELGIPFEPKFNQVTDKGQVLRKLRLSEGVITLLIMGGGQGLGPIKTIVRSLEKIKTNLQMIIVCGANKKIYKSLKKKIKKYKKRVALFGFIDNINELMDASDIIITKPGGITTAEALAKKIPMIIVKPIPGQEASNAEYLTRCGTAIEIDELKEIIPVIERLLNEPDALKRMRQAAENIARPNASFDIAKLLLRL